MRTRRPPAARVAMCLRRQFEQEHVQSLKTLREQRLAVEPSFQRCLSTLLLLQRVDPLQYPGAMRRLIRRLEGQLQPLRSDLQQLQSQADIDHVFFRPLPTAQLILQELRQVEDDFGSWALEDAGTCLSVATESIMLEGVFLGRFRIALDMLQLTARDAPLPIRAIALDPNAPASAPRVTHPHVNDDRICLGDAAVPLHRAVWSGRLSDVFLIIRNLLTTYNPDSPYVALEDWEGSPCADCGDMVNEESRYWCELCERDYCDSCTGMCRDCDQPTCFGCLRTCPHCDETYCHQCMCACVACDEPSCPSCLEDGHCPDCFESKETSDAHEENHQETLSPEPAGSNPAHHTLASPQEETQVAIT